MGSAIERNDTSNEFSGMASIYGGATAKKLDYPLSKKMTMPTVIANMLPAIAKRVNFLAPGVFLPANTCP